MLCALAWSGSSAIARSIRDDRIVQLESILQDDPEIAVPVRPIGLELETSLDQRDCLLAPPLLMREHS